MLVTVFVHIGNVEMGCKRMKLYNVSFNLNDLSKELIPRVPESVADGEDKVTPRVCLTDSVEHCMQAIAVGNRDIKVGAKFLLRVVDINTSRKKLVSPSTLKSSGKVYDALENNEYWYKDRIACELYLCEIKSFDYSYELAWTCIKAKDCKDIIKRYIKNFDFKGCTSSRDCFRKFADFVDKYSLYDIYDNVWDDLAELPWAQKVEISKLELTYKKL